jgi:succinate dehydrogenase / fumarate reductase membrane anchor subunit
LWRSVLLWLLQRITAVLLVLFLALHLWASNFTTNWAGYFRGLIDIALLALALFHGLNGVRTVALDFGLGLAGRRFLSASLTLVGIAAFMFGVFGIFPLLFAK